ncbi:MAG: type II toxin-antitoxin system death-on-curing family toxin [Bacteroidota bacterium]
MITVNEAIRRHNKLIDQFGGSMGVRDLGGLEAALARPYMTFDEQDLYPSPIDKAAAILESLIINHPFVDGNKRIAYGLMLLILAQNQLIINVSQNDQYDFVISASMGEIRFDEIKAWLEAKAISI